MCNEDVRREIVRRVCALGRVTSPSASIGDLKVQLGINVSNTTFKEALGSAIHNRMIIRNRPVPIGLCDDERPITLLPGPAAQEVCPAGTQPSPYFAP